MEEAMVPNIDKETLPTSDATATKMQLKKLELF